MPFITVNSGGPDIPDGAYPVQLSDIRGPKTVTAQRGPNAGQDVELLDWVFHVAQPGSPYDGQEIVGSTSTASGPRSKLYAWLTALLNGVPPQPNTSFEKDQLIGRLAVATIQKDTDGWPRLQALGVMLIPQGQQAFAAATNAPVAAPNPTPAPASVPAAPAQSTDALPF